MGPDPAVAAVRLAVRRSLSDLGDTSVLVACSGGADSLALLAATVFEARQRPWQVVGVTVDHALQEGSAERAEHVVAQMASLGADQTATVRVRVEGSGHGLEAAAREARYAALAELAQQFAPSVVLLGHTLDDQAETVLLGLTRGSGARSLAGMRREFEAFRRPLLDVTRAQTEAACAAQDLEFWSDPHNADPRFTRARVRHTVLPMLERELGPGVAATLARTADQLREDVAHLDAAAEAYAGTDLGVESLTALPDAIRRRVLRLAALGAGATGSELFRSHVLAMDRLLTDWHGQQWVELPGPVRVRREGERLVFS